MLRRLCNLKRVISLILATVLCFSGVFFSHAEGSESVNDMNPDVNGDFSCSHSWVETKTYLKKEAACDRGAVYYKECDLCGASSQNVTNEAWTDETSVLEHSLGDWVQIVAPTCEEMGLERRSCEGCMYFESRAILAIVHKRAAYYPLQDSTCIGIGYTAGLYCPDCDSWLEGHSVIEKKPHSFTQYSSDSNATCTDDGTKTAICDSCKTHTSVIADEDSRLGHEWTESETYLKLAASCTNDAQYYMECSRCGISSENETGESRTAAGTITQHDYLPWQTISEPTCFIEGEEGRGCSGCVYSERRAIEAIGHRNSVLHPEQESTCQKEGYTEGVYCPDCEEWLTGHELIGKKEHVFTLYKSDENATCTEDGTKTALCDSCQKVKDTLPDEESAKGHRYINAIVVDPTCTSRGYTTISCECGLGEKTDYTTELGHLYTTYHSDGNATYFEDGTKTSICDRGCSSYITVADKGSKLKLGTTKKINVTSGSATIKLSWSAVSDATGYAVYVQNDGWKLLGKTTAKAYTVKSLSKATKYTFAVRAYRVEGKKTIWASRYKSLETATKPGMVATLTETQTTDSITLKWSAVKGVTGYRIYKYNNGWKHVAYTKSTSYTAKSLLPGTKYIYCVRPYIKTADGYVWNDYTKISTATAPEAPSVRLASTAKGRATVAWDNVSGETGYQVYYSESKSSGFKKISNYNADTVKMYKKSLASGKTYYFKVRAYKKTDSGYVYGSFSSVKGVKIK